MIQSKTTCSEVPTNANRRWPYQQYYIGDNDEEQRNGDGQNHWSGAESLEWFTGRFFRDTMHGEGEYRWRFQGPENASITYEGQFYGNCMHGYGIMSYPDGRVFNGLFYKNMRWGPGIETHANVQEDVGLWRGTQLVRLAWRPQAPSVTLDLNTREGGKACVDPNRTVLTARVKNIGEVNSAIELLKQNGADPLLASEKWTKLYPKTCNDLESRACHVDVFDYEYYKNSLHVLEEDAAMNGESASESNHESTSKSYYAWNNSEMIKDMMKHCYKHETQREGSRLELKHILTGPRSHFKSPAAHELNCRTLLMASYLGHITNVAQLINENNLHPDVADIQGNTALMYAASGDQADIINFLSEAGANVNSFNDSCCTALGISLMRFVCARKGIPLNGMVQALIPPPIVQTPAPVGVDDIPYEWHIMIRDPAQTTISSLRKSYSKTAANKLQSIKKARTSQADVPPNTEKPDEGTDTLIEDKLLYKNINEEFTIKVAELFNQQNETFSYLFDVPDMVKQIDTSLDEPNKKTVEKNPKKIVSKVIKDTMKPSKEALWQSSDKDISSLSNEDKMKKEALDRNLSTIIQLLNDGADPRMVRCPQPELVMATISGCSELVRHLVNHGANVNEVFPQIYDYTALDIAVSQPLSFENLALVRTLLECGAKTDYTLKYGESHSDVTIPETSGPTLLHAVLVKKSDSEVEEEIRRQLLQLLLEYGCNSLKRFYGSSALDKSMSNTSLLDIFIRCPKVDLNAPMNDYNQTVLLKFFSMPLCKTVPITERLQTLTNLLLFGADPLLQCQDKEDNIFGNIFVFARKTLGEFDPAQSKSSSPNVGGKGKPDAKAKKDSKDKSKKDDKMSTKSVGKVGADDVGDYKQALDLVTECARMLHVRWLQGKLLKELIRVVEKYEHRHWNMIFPEHKNKKACGLWLSCPRTLEIWDILQLKKKKNFKDRRILRHVLCIVQFYSKRIKTSLKWPVKTEEKDLIEADVDVVLREHKIAKNMGTEHKIAKPYVMPELYVEAVDKKFEVCFECALPFGTNAKIQCSSCKMVSFCTLECMQANIDHIGCHPCSDFLRLKYFAAMEDSPNSTIMIP